MNSNDDSEKKLVIKSLFYVGILLVLFYLVLYLNIFPGAVDYKETEETITLETGSIVKEKHIFNKSELDISEQLGLSILTKDIDTLQNILRAFVLFTPFSLFFLIERNHYSFFSYNKKLKTFVLLLFILLIFILLSSGYILTLDNIRESIESLLRNE